jgi:hypothetical protein
MEIRTGIKETNLNLLSLLQETEEAQTSVFYHGVESLSLNNEHIEFLKITTQNTIYHFARQRSEHTDFTIWQVLSGRQDIIGKTVHLFCASENNKFEQLSKGDHLGIYLIDDPNSLPRYTSEISDLAVVV